MRAFTLASFALAASVSGSLAGLQAADPPTVTVAVVRGDGILIPFATRTGRRWSNTWPSPAKGADVPLRLADVPDDWWGRTGPVTTWHAWFVAGDRATATVDRPAWYPALCRGGVGLQTGMKARGPLPPPATAPFPKLGLAASRPLAFGRVETLDAGHAIWPVLRAALIKPVADAEARIYLQQFSDTTAPVAVQPAGLRYSNPPVRQPGSLRIERLHRVPLGAMRFLYYVEAVRRYPEAADATPTGPGASPASQRCEGLTFASGWFISDGVAVPRRVPLDVRLASCEYDGAEVMLPLGYLVEGSDTIWIAQLTSWEREVYVVVRASERRREPEMALVTAGGDCR